MIAPRPLHERILGAGAAPAGNMEALIGNPRQGEATEIRYLRSIRSGDRSQRRTLGCISSRRREAAA